MGMTISKIDHDGITDISLKGIQEMKDSGEELNYVYIQTKVNNRPYMLVRFVFKSGSSYTASGFAVGYGGEGPHGLHKAIRMFDNKIDEDFWNTSISILSTDYNWKYTPGKDGRFEGIVSFVETL